MNAPVLDAENIHITRHAMARYCQRRDTSPQAVEAGVRRLLGRAAAKGAVPPLQVKQGALSRRWVVGGHVLITNADCTTLITLFPRKGR